MNFFDRVFPLPFINQGAFEAFILTGIWVIGLIFIFIISAIYLYTRGHLLKKALKNNSLPKWKSLNPIWEAYHSTFSRFEDKRKTSIHSEEYFNDNNIFFAFLNYRLISNIPNIIVGLGILGTFVGLAKGISGITTTEGTDQLANSIDNLMGGMSTAFVTSIWGMGLSVFFTAIFRHWQTRISRAIQNFSFKLDRDNLISTEDLENHREIKQKELISQLFDEYLVADTQEGKELPKNVFRRILEESEKQTKSLQSFSDDLADSITAAMELMVSENNSQISSLIEEKLVPVLEDLKQIKQDSGTQVIENAVQRLSDSMKEMLQEFKNSIAGDTKQEMEGLASRLSSVSESLSSIPESMTNMSLEVSEMIEALKNNVLEEISNTKEETARINEENRRAFKEAKSEYQESVSDIQAHMELMLSTQKDNIKQVSDLTVEINNNLERSNSVNKQYETIIQGFQGISSTLENLTSNLHENTSAISETSSDLQEATRLFRLNIKEYLDKNIELINEHKTTLTRTKDYTQEFTDKFEIIESSLQSIFGQIQTGLKDYQNSTAEGLNRYLKEFTTHLTNAQSGLESNIANLGEIAEDLVDQVERLNSTR